MRNFEQTGKTPRSGFQKLQKKHLQWIGLRENLQETMVFTIKYKGFHGGSWKFSHHPTLWHQSRFSYRRAQSSVVPVLNSTLSVPTACETAWPICSCLLDITYWLVVSAPLKNISQIGSSSQLFGENKKCSKPPISLKYPPWFSDKNGDLQ